MKIQSYINKLLVNENTIMENNKLTTEEIDTIFNNVKKYISENNNTNNHYHNNKHLIDVFNNSMLLFNKHPNENELTNLDKLCLGLAALFHDYGHSGGKSKDSENIEIALVELKKYLNAINKQILFKNIKEIINATEFPHKEMNLNILQQIIRDADTMGGIMNNWISIVKSLAKEYDKTLNEFIPAQIKFIENVKFNTVYCNDLLKNNKTEILEKLKELNK